MKLYKYILFLFWLTSTVAFSDNFERLEKILKGVIHHSRSIKTIRMTVEEKYSRTGKPTLNQKYRIIYRRKDNHWFGEFVKEHSVDSKKKKTTGVRERIDNEELLFHTTKNCGLVEEAKNDSFENIQNVGLISLFQSNNDINDYLDRVLGTSTKSISIKDSIVNGLQVLDVKIQREGNLQLRLCFVPSWQYGICFAEAKDNESIHKTSVEMNKDTTSNIWFPSKQHTEYIENDEKIWSKTYEFSDVILNEPVTDEQICFEIPKGARITNDINNEIYEISEPAILEDILEGKLASIQEEKRPKMTARAKASLWWYKVTSSLFFRIFLILALTGLLYIVISRTIKKVTSSSD